MTGQRTALRRHVTERQKARARLPLLVFLALVGPPLAGVNSPPVWVVYIVFVLLYCLWSIRLSRRFSDDRRLGYLLCLTDAAILLPLLTWSSAASMRALLLAVCGTGLALSFVADRGRLEGGTAISLKKHAGERWKSPTRQPESDPAAGLERAVRLRLRVFASTGTRFGLVVLRVLRFEETASYYGQDVSERVLGAVSRRGLRMLGPDAQHFPLPGGKVAFLFEMDPEAGLADDQAEGRLRWSDPYDIEGLAMTIGRKACDHLIDGHRVECVVGWASAPADGLNADDLLYAAESGAQSTAAFRRIASPRVPVPERARAAG